VNGAPEFRPYTYRGTGQDTLTAWMDSRSYTLRAVRYHADSQPHGTVAAYKRHYRHGEKPCESCRQAEAIAKADRRRRRAA